jgi:hypothetical protein
MTSPVMRLIACILVSSANLLLVCCRDGRSDSPPPRRGPLGPAADSAFRHAINPACFGMPGLMLPEEAPMDTMCRAIVRDTIRTVWSSADRTVSRLSLRWRSASQADRSDFDSLSSVFNSRYGPGVPSCPDPDVAQGARWQAPGYFIRLSKHERDATVEFVRNVGRPYSRLPCPYGSDDER